MADIKEQLFQNLDDLIALFKEKCEQEITVLANQVKRLEERMAKLESGKR